MIFCEENGDRQRSRGDWKKRIASIFLTNLFLLSIVESSTNVTECCPGGQIFAKKDNLTCACFTEYHQFGIDDYPSICEEYRDTSLFAAIPNFNKCAPSECVDLVRDEINFRVQATVYPCQVAEYWKANESNSYDTNSEILPIGNFSRPFIRPLRICCYKNDVYDMEKRDCIHGDDDLPLHNYLKSIQTEDDFIVVINRTAPLCLFAIVTYVINTTQHLRIIPDGAYLGIEVPWSYEPKIGFVDPFHICFDPGNESTPGQSIIRLCTDSEYCKNYTCVRKCCPEGQGVYGSDCLDVPKTEIPGRFNSELLTESRLRGTEAAAEFLNTSDYGLLIGVECFLALPISPEEQWYLNQRGQIVFYSTHYDHDDYCIDINYEPNPQGELKLYVCVLYSIPTSEDYIKSSWVRLTLHVVNLICLTLTLLVYIYLPELRNLHGKTLMSYLVSGIILNTLGISIVAMKAANVDDVLIAAKWTVCLSMGYVSAFVVMSQYSWLNVMCFDIWRTFGRGVTTDSRGVRRTYRKRFITYSLYAWGFPLILLVICYIIDRTKILPIRYRPNIATHHNCLFHNDPYHYGQVIFNYTPVTIQFTANLIFFILTTKHYRKVKKEIKRATKALEVFRNKKFHADKMLLKMYVKLFIIMGASLILETVGALLEDYADSDDPTLITKCVYITVLIFTFFHSFQGVMIFILFVMKRKIYYALKQRFGWTSSKNSKISCENTQLCDTK